MKMANILNPVHVYRKRQWVWPKLKRVGHNAHIRLHKARIRLGIPTSINDLRLALLRNKHRGCRAFVIGNGPSLRVADLDRLSRNDEIGFGANKIYLAFGSTAWRPTYYLVIDELALTDPRFYDQDYGSSRFLLTKQIAGCIDTGRIRNQMISYQELKEHEWTYEGSPQLPPFSDNAFRHVAWGSTVTFAAIQLAAYMGIREVYLLGVDASYNPIQGVSRGGIMLRADGTEKNHFHPDYHPAGSLTYPGEIERQTKSYRKALEYSRERGSSFRIFNATRGGKLEVFPRVDFDSLF